MTGSIVCAPSAPVPNEDEFLERQDRADFDTLEKATDIRVHALDREAYQYEVLHELSVQGNKRRLAGEIRNYWDEYEGGLPHVVDESQMIIVPPGYFTDPLSPDEIEVAERRAHEKHEYAPDPPFNADAEPGEWPPPDDVENPLIPKRRLPTPPCRARRKKDLLRLGNPIAKDKNVDAMKIEEDKDTQHESQESSPEDEEDEKGADVPDRLPILRVNLPFYIFVMEALEGAGDAGMRIETMIEKFNAANPLDPITRKDAVETLWDLCLRGDIFRVFGWDHERYVHEKQSKYYQIPLCRITVEHPKWHEIMRDYQKANGIIPQGDSSDPPKDEEGNVVKIEDVSEHKTDTTPFSPVGMPTTPANVTDPGRTADGKKKSSKKRKRKNEDDEDEEDEDGNNEACVEFSRDMTKSMAATPWAYLMGDVQGEFIEDLKSGITFIVATNPGISVEELHRKLERVVTPAQLLFLLHVFEDNGSIKIREIEQDEPSLFGDLRFAPGEGPDSGAGRTPRYRIHLFPKYTDDTHRTVEPLAPDPSAVPPPAERDDFFLDEDGPDPDILRQYALHRHTEGVAPVLDSDDRQWPDELL